MLPEERDLLLSFLTRLTRNVPQTKDPEADGLIVGVLRSSPNAYYALVQQALVQEHALKEAQSRIAELEVRLREQPSQATSFLGGALDSSPARGNEAWGNHSSVNAPPAGSSVLAPGWKEAAVPQESGAAGGSSFLKSAAATAAGVVGGSLLFQGLSSLFHHSPAQTAFGSDNHFTSIPAAGETTVINNYYGNQAPGDDSLTDGSLDSFDDPLPDGGDDSIDV